MDFRALKDNFRFRSGRSKRNPNYTSKRFPTREPPKYQPQRQTQLSDNQNKLDGLEDDKEPKPTQIQLSKPKRKKRTSSRPQHGELNKDSVSGKGGEPVAETLVEAEDSSLSAPLPKEVELKSVEPSLSEPKESPNGNNDRTSELDPESPRQAPDSSAQPDIMPETNAQIDSHSSGEDFDLRPGRAMPRPRPPSLETLSELLFSDGYLNTLTSDPGLLSRFTSFLNRYRPGATELVKRYIETQKVIKALEYANAVAAGLGDSAKNAAELSPAFKDDAQKAYTTLLRDTLPAWVTYSLVKTATACLTAEITNASTPLTRDLVGGLSEVFCITDPTQEDNPIVYSSEEFYRLTEYDKDSVIGHNCRFLQGSRTLKESVSRLREALAQGREICEVLLNYRRNGSPFINLLMLAPLHDDKGKVRYYLGAQVDASRLLAEGRGLDGFERFLLSREMDVDRGRGETKDFKKVALAKLRDLSLTFDLEESAVVQSNSRSSSRTREDGETGASGSTGQGPRKTRRVLNDEEDESLSGDESDEEQKQDPAWRLSQDSLASGSLPGIYQQYLLIRPYPSFRIVFVSRAMRKLGRLQQRPFLAHVAAPKSTLIGLKESLESNMPVTAKIALMSEGRRRDGTLTGKWGRKSDDDPAKHGKTCWMSATPLLDGNNKVGVWMVVIADKTSIVSHIGQLAEPAQELRTEATKPNGASKHSENTGEQKELPIKPKRVGDFDIAPTNATSKKDVSEGQIPEVSVGQDGKPSSDTDEGQIDRMTDSGYEDNVAKQHDDLQHGSNARLAKVPQENDSENEVFSDAEADNEPPTTVESLNGLVSPRADQGASHNGDLSTPTRATYQVDSEVTPTRPQHQGGHSARPSTLGMDYLNARSPRQSRLQAGAKSPNESDWPCRSPYSVD